MYYVDSPTQTVWAFDYDLRNGQLSNRRAHIVVPLEHGVPDGITIDAEDHLWVAHWGGWAVRRYDPHGGLRLIVRFPVSQVSSCTFGGPDLTDLYVTSATDTLSAEQLRNEPHAGGLFRYRTAAQGLAADPFGV